MRTNLISNPSFEVGTTGWTESLGGFTGITFAKQSGWSEHGSSSLRVTLQKDNSATLRNCVIYTAEIPVEEEKPFSFTAKANILDAPATSNDRMGISINWTDSGHNYLSSSYSQAETTIGEKDLLLLGVAPTNAAYATAIIDTRSTTALDTIDFYVDALLFEQFDDWPGISDQYSFYDDLSGAAGPIDGRVAATGHVWDDLNDSVDLDGSGRMIRDPTVSVPGSCYAKIALNSSVTLMRSVVSWLGVSPIPDGASSCVMIYAAEDERLGVYPHLSPFKNFVHMVFSPWHYEIDTYTDDTPTMKAFELFPGGRLAIDGTVYEIRVERRGSTLSVIGPDGVAGIPFQRQFTDPLFSTYGGRYMVFQVYDDIHTDLSPRIEYAAAGSPVLAPSQVPGTYFDGSTVGAGWTGTHHESQSLEYDNDLREGVAVPTAFP